MTEITEDQTKPKLSFSKSDTWKMVAVRTLILAAAIVLAYFLFKKLVPWMVGQGGIWVGLGILLGIFIVVGLIAVLIFFGKSISEAIDKFAELRGEVTKDLEDKDDDFKIKLPPKKLEPELEPIPTEKTTIVTDEKGILPTIPEDDPGENSKKTPLPTEPPPPPPTTTSQSEVLPKTVDFGKLKQLNILRRIMRKYNIGVPRDHEGNIIEGTENHLLQDFQEINNIFALTSNLGISLNGHENNFGILSAETIFRVGKLLNPNLLFMSTIVGQGDNKFKNLEQSKNLIAEKFLKKEPFEAIFWLPIITNTQPIVTLTHYIFIKGEVIDGHYIINIDDSITKGKNPDNTYILSDFSFVLQKALAETLIVTETNVNYVHSRKQLFGVECGQHSLDRAFEKYLIEIGCVEPDYDNDWVDEPAEFTKQQAELAKKNKQNEAPKKNYGNYDQYIHHRTLAIFILETQSGIEEFFKTQFLDLFYEEGLGNNVRMVDNLIREFYQNIKAKTQEIQRLFMVANRDLNLNPKSNPNDMATFENNLAKYEAQIFQIYYNEAKNEAKEIMRNSHIIKSHIIKSEEINTFFNHGKFARGIIETIKVAIPSLLQTHSPTTDLGPRSRSGSESE